MPAEHLDFPDSTFAHSTTNFSIMFLQDAVVTTWTDLGYLGPMLQAAQREMHPICCPS